MTQPRDAAMIQNEIEVTRAQLAGTLDELAERVSPKRLAEQARQQALGTTRGRVVLGGLGGLVVAYVGLRIIVGRRRNGRRRKR